MPARHKRLNEMNRLTDMLHFPAPVNAAATANVLVTMIATWLFAPRFPWLVAPWIAFILLLNLLPVVILRRTRNRETNYPRLVQMDFFRDQHKFSDWVYVAASANMAFWILFLWTPALYLHNRLVLLAALAIAAFATFFPVLFRGQIRAAEDVRTGNRAR